ncbi:cytochrome b [Halopseudomonas sp.]|uniref:cytochrome b n=1 Tax=Halopseudomonas sp. TaxID=2901191 RepID=UPI00356A96F0
MQVRNTRKTYGLMAVSLHWIIALGVIGTAILGLWMTGLDYYSAWYRSAPFWHKSIGITLATLIILRLLWRWSNPRPAPLPHHPRWEVRLASLVHALLYLLLFIIIASGYLISTAKGQGVSIFGWFELPAIVTGLPAQADRAGFAHYWLGVSLLGLIALHALGALKHHFLDHDNTLRRMLGMRSRTSEEKDA